MLRRPWHACFCWYPNDFPIFSIASSFCGFFTNERDSIFSNSNMCDRAGDTQGESHHGATLFQALCFRFLYSDP